VRRLAGIAFPGTEATGSWLLGDVVLTDPASLPVGSHRSASGSVVVIPRPGYVRVITAERTRPADREAPVTLDAFRAAVCLALGRDIEMTEPRWLTRFGDAARQAERYVSGRVVLAGDAAHIHPPAGAQGLNVGLQDAFNLGWKLAAQVRRWAPPGFVETYHTERHAAGARVLLNTRAQVALAEPGEKFDSAPCTIHRADGVRAGPPLSDRDRHRRRHALRNGVMRAAFASGTPGTELAVRYLRGSVESLRSPTFRSRGPVRLGRSIRPTGRGGRLVRPGGHGCGEVPRRVRRGRSLDPA
jgi:2-polyprenyl-6-methoxyphenol hydroxylase-like FAD-dependent oxidoreductase